MTDDLPGKFEKPDTRSVLIPDRYLGDGVTASFDGYHVWLRTPREGGVIHEIALEPEVFDALHVFVQDIATIATATQPPTTD